MIKNHVFDRYLKEANGNAEAEKRIMGNFLLEEAKKKAEEWNQSLEQFLPVESDVDDLPDGSWLLQLEFALAKPFASKSEGEFHHYEGQNGPEIHNPIVRDHLTGLPMVKSTTWKGHLRFASRMSRIDREIINRLFGSSKGGESGQAGRLHFCPTFFTGDPEQEVITPLSRDTRTPARGPLYTEVIPKGSAGTLSLLYIPWPKGHDWFVDQIAEDLNATAKALKFMLLKYGFSAKKTSGWGVVKDKLEKGTLIAKGSMWPELQPSGEIDDKRTFQNPQEAFLKFMDEAGNPEPGLRDNDRWLSNSKYDSLTEKPGSKTEYKRFRSWYDEHGTRWRRLQGYETPSPSLRQTYSVESVTAFVDLANQLAEILRKEICRD
ncbi:MAG: hypothetical protein IBX64_13525 [Actinobacteria bacterium]|nr:hypothetical protein [Actinomycetota bacterium]